MPRVITWNMQGANWTSDIKWRTGLANLFANAHADVVCLQETGPIPASAQHVWQSLVDPLLHIYRWRYGRGYLYILFYNWDLLGNRVNLAVVSRAQFALADVLALQVPLFGPVHRPALGVRIAGWSIYSVHAISPGGPDAVGLLAAIGIFAPAGNVIVCGDFNHFPGGMLGGLNVCPPDGNTHSTRIMHPANCYDYAYTNLAARPGTRCNLIMSDHFPVMYDF